MAVLFPDGHKERMKFVEEVGVAWELVRDESLDRVVGLVPLHQMVSTENPSRVGIHDKDRLLPGVEEDGIGCLRADPWQVQQPVPEDGGAGPEHPSSVGSIPGHIPATEGLQAHRLLTKIPRGTDQPLQPGDAKTKEPMSREGTGSFQPRDRLLHIVPGGRLR